MEKTVYLQEGADKYNTLVTDVLRFLNEDVRQVSDKLGLSFTTLEQIRKFDAKALGEFISNSKAALLGKASTATTFVPQEIRRFYDTTFKHTQDEVMPIIGDIANRLRQLESKGLKPQWRNGKVAVDEKEQQRKANEFATYHFTDEQLEYGNMIEDIADRLNALQDYEKAQKWNLWTHGVGGNNMAVTDILRTLLQKDGKFALMAKTYFELIIRGQICFNKDQAQMKRQEMEASDNGDE